jgi:acyl dehydratase
MTTQIRKESIADYLGFQVPPTQWFTITQAKIDAFAECTNDYQFIHTDPEKAASTPFGGTVAHGFLTLSMLSQFAKEFMLELEGVKMGVNYGFDKVRFISPVKTGSRIRAHAAILDFVEKSENSFQVTVDVNIEIEGQEKPALQAIWISRQFL